MRPEIADDIGIRNGGWANVPLETLNGALWLARRTSSLGGADPDRLGIVCSNIKLLETAPLSENREKKEKGGGTEKKCRNLGQTWALEEFWAVRKLSGLVTNEQENNISPTESRKNKKKNKSALMDDLYLESKKGGVISICSDVGFHEMFL